MAYNQFAYYYDRLMDEMPYDEWLEFLSLCWKKHGQPQTIADLGCGTGSIAIPLAQLGYEVTGIDLSEDMLAVAQHKASEALQAKPFPAKGSLTWLQQDMRDWISMRPLDAVISLCDCLNYLQEESEIKAAFAHAYAALKPNGLFVFDMHTIHQLELYAESQPFFMNEDDIAYIWTSELDEDRHEIEHALTIFAEVPVKSDESAHESITHEAAGRFVRVDEYHVQRAYELEWLEQALYEAGFTAVEKYGDFTWEPVTELTQRAFFVARK